MEVNKFVGKDYDSTLKLALETLKCEKNDVVIHSEEKKMGLFKGIGYELTVTPLTDIIEFAKEYLKELLTVMGLEVTFETKIRDNQISIKMYSNDNPILIGQGGRTLSSLQIIIRLVVKNKFGTTPYISLDVENYKDMDFRPVQRKQQESWSGFQRH